MAAKKKAKKEVEVIEAEVVETETVENNNLLSLKEFVSLKDNYDNLKDIVNLVRGLLNDTVRNYLKIGFLLNSITEQQLKDLGCDSIYEFSKQNFDLGVTSTKNFINVFKRFGEYNPPYKELPIDYSGSYIDLKGEFKEYSMSQLVELLPVEDEDLKKFSPGMTTNEIRSLKKINQLSDFESNFYKKVETAFLEIWSKVYSSLKFETKNKLANKKIIFDGNGSYTFNLPCLNKNIVILLSVEISSNQFSIVCNTPTINYSYKRRYFCVNFETNKDYSNVEKDIINFINNDCCKFLEENSKGTRKSELDMLLIDIERKYKGKQIKLCDLKKGDFLKAYEMIEKKDYYSLKKLIDSFSDYQNIPFNLFQEEFELQDIGLYDLTLSKEIFENSPEGHNSNYSLKLVLTNDYNSRMLFDYKCGSNLDGISIDSLFKKYYTYSIPENESNCLAKIFVYFAKIWAFDLYNDQMKKKNEDNDDESEEI